MTAVEPELKSKLKLNTPEEYLGLEVDSEILNEFRK
jgi:hypothetical protein